MIIVMSPIDQTCGLQFISSTC